MTTGDLVQINLRPNDKRKLSGIIIEKRMPTKYDGSDYSLIGMWQYLIYWSNGETWEASIDEIIMI